MRLKYDDPRTVKIVERQRTSTGPENNTDRNRTPIPGSSNVSGIEIRMLPPLIKNNRTIKFWPFPGKAKLYCVTLVVSDVANQLFGHLDLNSFAKVGDNERLPVNKTIFYWEKPDDDTPAPNQVHVMSSIIKSKGALREAGNILASLKTDNEYSELIEQLSVLSTNVSTYNMVRDISLQLSKLIGQYLGRIEDRPLGAAIHSFTRLHGDWDELGVKPFQVISDNVDFNFELVVRDHERYQLSQRQVLLSPEAEKVRAGCEQMIPIFNHPSGVGSSKSSR